MNGIDDVWVNPAGELMIVDYKSTSKDEKIEVLDKEWHDGYKHQMEVYQWLFRRNGFKVSDTGYFVYANATRPRGGETDPASETGATSIGRSSQVLRARKAPWGSERRKSSRRTSSCRRC